MRKLYRFNKIILLTQLGQDKTDLQVVWFILLLWRETDNDHLYRKETWRCYYIFFKNLSKVNFLIDFCIHTNITLPFSTRLLSFKINFWCRWKSLIRCFKCQMRQNGKFISQQLIILIFKHSSCFKCSCLTVQRIFKNELDIYLPPTRHWPRWAWWALVLILTWEQCEHSDLVQLQSSSQLSEKCQKYCIFKFWQLF